MNKRFLILLSLSLPLLGIACAEVRSRDCWFDYSNPIDYSAVLKTPDDPLMDLWFLPYSPCTFGQKTAEAHRGE